MIFIYIYICYVNFYILVTHLGYVHVAGVVESTMCSLMVLKRVACFQELTEGSQMSIKLIKV